MCSSRKHSITSIPPILWRALLLWITHTTISFIPGGACHAPHKLECSVIELGWVPPEENIFNKTAVTLWKTITIRRVKILK